MPEVPTPSIAAVPLPLPPLPPPRPARMAGSSKGGPTAKLYNGMEWRRSHRRQSVLHGWIDVPPDGALDTDISGPKSEGDDSLEVRVGPMIYGRSDTQDELVAYTVDEPGRRTPI